MSQNRSRHKRKTALLGWVPFFYLCSKHNSDLSGTLKAPLFFNLLIQYRLLALKRIRINWDWCTKAYLWSSLLKKLHARLWCLSESSSASCKKFLLNFSASFEKSGLNNENLDILVCQVLAKNAAARWTEAVHALGSQYMGFVVVFCRKQKCFLLCNYSQNWGFLGQLRNKFVCKSVFCIECVCVCGHRCSFGRWPLVFNERDVGQWWGHFDQTGGGIWHQHQDQLGWWSHTTAQPTKSFSIFGSSSLQGPS